MSNRWRLLDNFAVQDVSSGKTFNPLKPENRIRAEQLAEDGEYGLLEIVNQLETDNNFYMPRMAADDPLAVEALKYLNQQSTEDIETAIGNRISSRDEALNSALSDAETYSNDRAKDFKRLGLVKDVKKVGKGDLAAAEQQLYDLGVLRGNVPMPLMVDADGNRRAHRVHTQYAPNQTTGQEQVVPYMDPSDANKTLRTYFGDMDDNLQGKFDFASEYIGQQALKLAGRKVSANNQNIALDERGNPMIDYRTNKPKVATWRADLIDSEDPKGRIDVERGDSRMDKYTLPIQLTAKMQVNDSNEKGQAALKRFMQENPEIQSVPEAVWRIRESDIVKNDDNKYYLGKGFKTNMQDPKDTIDKVLSVLYPREERISATVDNNIGSNVGRTTPIEDLNLIDLSAGMSVAEEVGRKVEFNREGIQTPYVHAIDYQDRTSGAYDPRKKVKINLPKGSIVQSDNVNYGAKAGDKFSTNLLDDSPLTQQLLTTELMKLRQI